MLIDCYDIPRIPLVHDMTADLPTQYTAQETEANLHMGHAFESALIDLLVRFGE
jgi:hypothetical protein